MINEVCIPLQILDKSIDVPKYAYSGDAGMDLRSTLNVELDPFERILIPCGFAMSLPEGYAGLVVPRSGLAIKHGISVLNAPGLIDNNYRGEVGVILVNFDPSQKFIVNKGDRIAQLVIVRVDAVSYCLTDNLSTTDRGEGGFGSSGRS